MAVGEESDKSLELLHPLDLAESAFKGFYVHYATGALINDYCYFI